jgi:hypothetical protein
MPKFIMVPCKAFKLLIQEKYDAMGAEHDL